MAQVPAAGLTVLVEPDEPTIDVVFVHGFTGHPERTWTNRKGHDPTSYSRTNSQDSNEPPAKSRRLDLFSRPSRAHTTTTPVYWPRDLLPQTLPEARVLTFGYDTHIRHVLQAPTSQSTVYDHAEELLVGLESHRRDCVQRSLLFVAHSLGGIVVKEMLRRSRNDNLGRTDHRQIFDATRGAMFFGTPHGGANPQNLFRDITEKFAASLGFSVNKELVRSLLPSSERLKELRDEFGPMAQREGWIVYSFQEDLGLRALNGKKVVEDASSSLGLPTLETKQHIGRDHREMCRFSGPDDAEYRKVAAGLERIAKSSAPTSTATVGHVLSEQDKERLLKSLEFTQVDTRLANIKAVHRKTCGWLLQKKEYMDWSDPTKRPQHHGFMWIKGKPGAGKSTLMKFAFSNMRRTKKDRLTISFFFNARGDDLEKSTTGMYRSLLLQLFTKLPKLRNVLDVLETPRNSGWSIEPLKDLFREAVLHLAGQHVVCFIDALDECNTDQIRDMIRTFEDLVAVSTEQGIHFQVCLASRYYPHISMKHGVNLDLNGQEGHEQDIESYIDNELKIGQETPAVQAIHETLRLKARGVFMWVVLVVDILNKEFDAGRSERRLRRKLDDIPGDLHSLFRDILTRDRQDPQELLLSIQWVLFARRPLSPEELYFAVLSGTMPGDLATWDPDELPIDRIRRSILNDSKGLTEITKSEAPTVQFIHESVRDYLLKDGGLQVLSSDLETRLVGKCHNRLLECCMRYVHLDTSQVMPETPLPKASSIEAKELRKLAGHTFPLLEYATTNMLFHADAAEGGGVRQDVLLQSFPREHWIELWNLWETHQVRRYNPAASFLYLAAEQNAGNLIKIHPHPEDCFKKENQRYGCPWVAAQATKNSEAVIAILETEARSAPVSSPLHALCAQYIEAGGSTDAKYSRDYRPPRKGDLLDEALAQDDLVLLFHSLGPTPHDSESKRVRHAYCLGLLRAAEMNYIRVATSLLELPFPNHIFQEVFGEQPVHGAIRTGNETQVSILLACNPNVVRENNGTRGTVLHTAAGYGRRAMVDMLLNFNPDIEAKDCRGRTPLALAVSMANNDDVVRTLLDRGADIEARDESGQSPLALASSTEGNRATVELLLDHGALIESIDRDNGTPLSWAIWDGDAEVVELLLERGAVFDTRHHPMLFGAVRRGKLAIVDTLLSRFSDIDLDMRDECHNTMLLHAVLGSRYAIVQSLVNGGADIELDNARKLTPLYRSTVIRDPRIANLLLDHGARIDTKSDEGETPLMMACGRLGSSAARRNLLARGADVNATDLQGRTALMHLIEYSDAAPKAVGELLRDGADAGVTDKRGMTARSLAVSRGKLHIVEEIDRWELMRRVSQDGQPAPE